MKETKVYVDELPESCVYCPCCSCNLKPEFIEIGDFMYCNLLKQKFRFKEERKKLKDCPLQSLKTHDRELVNEVCEKIRRKVDNISMHTATKERLMIMCEEIQQEFEDERF